MLFDASITIYIIIQHLAIYNVVSEEGDCIECQ